MTNVPFRLQSLYDGFDFRHPDCKLSTRPLQPVSSIMAAATALLSEPQLRAQLLVPDPIGIGEQLRSLLSRLTDGDRVAPLKRSRQWPLAWRGYLDLILAAGLEAEITTPLRPRRGGMGPAQSGARELPEAPNLLI